MSCEEIKIEQQGQQGILFQHSFTLNKSGEWLALRAVHPLAQWLQIWVKDPQGNIRMQYLGKGEENTLLLTAEPGDSTCGSVPGAVPAGQWSVQVLAVNRESAPSYSLHIQSGEGTPGIEGTLHPVGSRLWSGLPAASGALNYELYDWNRVHSTEARWYRGDFHMHTRLTDGKQTAEELNAQAVRQGLDFIVVTEHNFLTTGWPDTNLLVIPGVEITSSQGHCNILGIRSWIDWIGEGGAPAFETSAGMEAILAEARSQGAVCSLNHPELAPWDWQLDVRLDVFDTIEIWNDPTFPDNEKATEEALKLWDMLWKHGVTLWGIGGSDTHNLPHESYVPDGPPSLVGDPVTWVWSEELSVHGILNAVRGGRSCVTRGPVLEPRLYANERIYRPGDQVRHEGQSNSLVHYDYELRVEDAGEGSYIRWMVDGVEAGLTGCGKGGDYTYSFTWPSGEYHFIRAEIRDSAGGLLAFTNPVYQGTPVPKLSTWGELKVQMQIKNMR
ncbi:CehA/McbA family metallohydrolase [Paenibacillus sp. YPG26]|uniref:CehA/McbA family metallohydrolase n=1 Tax=Paenibacillus sp. YPG26 TaxID=2878915 RepID=UPI0020402E0C|nr:CehA/McbA family metallohydrolase [Paenibacillus sp. YPG26]USB34123.1 CehA/McbA family metallohydrolase [Paenibacillus sp. YPG26]